MEEDKIIIEQINPENFEFQDYIESDEQLIGISDLDTVFNQETDYIEYCIYDESNSKIYPISDTANLFSYKILQGDIILYPKKDLINLGFDDSTYSILYNFYRKRLSSSITSNYYIKEISSDRTEIRLDSNSISNLDLISSTNEFIRYRNDREYFVDFLLNFGNNKTIIANNIKLEDETTDDPTILIKLYEPLPGEFDLKSTLWVVEEISTPQMYKVTFPFIPIIEVNSSFISGPNFNLQIKNESGASGQLYNLNTLLDSNLTSSVNQLQNLLDQREIKINVDYESYSNFVNFSSAKTRLENFVYKAGLIESYTNSISSSLGKIEGDTTGSFAFSASKADYESKINNIIKNFDGYDYFLYYNSGSKYSWPKENSTPPYNLYSTGSTEALEWLGSADPASIYYGGQALSASNYDQNNQDYLYWAIPEYLRDDANNNQYLLFVDMVAQQYDNTWVYTKDLTNKFNADNRLEYGISKDLVADAIKDFGIKLYSNNFNTNDLYTTFLGLTPSGSLFPFPEITGSFPTPSGYEFVDTFISSSNDAIPLEGVEKRIYKRLYHNLPYLFKTKGTITGLRALISSYGIPDTILRINEFGGKDRINSNDWDLKQKVFNYAFDTKGIHSLSSSFDPNTNISNGLDSPATVQLRFKTRGIPTNKYSQSLWELESGVSALVLEYTGSGLASGSYSGSTVDPYNKYGTLKFVPDTTQPSYSASLYFPFFDAGWWSVQTTLDSSNTASLFAANNIRGKLGFSGSSSTHGFTANYYNDATTIHFPNDGANFTLESNNYEGFSGSYQEIRYYNKAISSSVFYDYTMNPYSTEGNSVNSAPSELIFRADLGTLLNTGSTTSVHPKITGSSNFITQSFTSNSEFFISASNFVINRENIYQDQVVGGIKNRITDKITTNPNIIPEGNTLSPLQSIQQTSFVSASYTPSIDYLEVAFSPQDQINDDINAQMGYFNIGDYIGDPRHISQSSRNYPDLDTLRDAYFNKYISSYNLVDFVRLIKFFDNSLFKMIKDFTPARTSLASGVVVKQHILERNRVRPPQASFSNVTYSGSIKPQARNYNTGSGDVSPSDFISGSSIYKFSGGTGGSFERFNGLQTSPSASAYGLSNRFGLTQSYSESKEGKLGRETINVWNQEEFYDGEFSGSEATATTQSLSPGCIVYHKNPDIALRYYPLFFSDSSTDAIFGTTTLELWNDTRNEPLSGYAWIFTEFDQKTQRSSVKKVKISGTDINGNNVRDYLLGTEFVQFIFPEGFKQYYVDGTVINTNSATLNIENDRGDYRFVSSSNGGTENWSLRVSGNISGGNAENSPGFNEFTQNYFHALSNNQQQPIRYYNGEYRDILGLFNTGSRNYETTNLFNDTDGYYFGSYTIPRTSNVPWVISASIAYSASGGGLVAQNFDSEGIYHSGSFFGASSTPQSFFISPTNVGTSRPSGSFILPGQTSNIDLDTTYFNTSVNANIPGNSGSGAPTAGHPQVKVAGTASLNFDFEEFTLGGTQPTPPTPTLKFEELQGPDNAKGSPTNPSFVGTISPLASGYASFPSGSKNGMVSIDVQDLYTYLVDGFNANLNQGVTLSITYSVTGNSGIRTSSPNNKVQIFEEVRVDNLGGFTAISGTDRTMTTLSPTAAVTGFSPAQINSLTGLLQTYPIPSGQTYNILLKIGGAAQTLNYEVDSMRIQISFRDTNNFFQVQDVLSSMTQAAADIIYLSSVDTYLKGGVRQLLYLTGSNHNPKQLITASNEIYGQLLTGSATLTFPDSPINNITRTSSYAIQRFAVTESSGANSVTFQYTDPHTQNTISSTLAAGSSGIFGIRNGGTQPTKTGGSGTIVSQSVGDAETVYSTINTSQSMFFIEQTFFSSSYADGSTTRQTELEPFNDSVYPILALTNSVQSQEEGYDFTGSLQVYKGNADNLGTIGNPVFSVDFIVPNSESTAGPAYGSNNIQVSGSFVSNFAYNDNFRLVIDVNKSIPSFLDITDYTMSIFPSESKFASITTDFAFYGDVPGSASYATSSYGGDTTILSPGFGKFSQPIATRTIIPSYYGGTILPFALALDCQPLINNYNAQRKSSYLMDVDYTNISGSIIPVNFLQILSGSAAKATVPDSNYTQVPWIRGRYDGVKTTSNEYNIWTPNDIDTYGQLPVIELRTAFFGYWNSIKNLYPIINDVTQLNVIYFVDQQGNAIPPNLNAGFGQAIIEKAYNDGDLVTFSINSGSGVLEDMDGTANIRKVGLSPFPVLYSQNGGQSYVRQIPLSGSGRLSLYDNNDSNSFLDYTFVAEGTSSFQDDYSIPAAGTRGGDSGFVYSQSINPSLASSSRYSDAAEHRFPYSSSGANIGTIQFSGSSADSGKDLSNPTYLDFETSFATSFLYEGYRRRTNEGDELRITIQMLVNGEGVPFGFDDLQLRVHKNSGGVIDCGTVIGTGIDRLARFRESVARTRRRNRGIKYQNNSKYNTQEKGYVLEIENHPLEDFMNQKGAYVKGQGDVQKDGDITGLEWVITGNSGEHVFKIDDKVEFMVKIRLLSSIHRQSNTLFPASYTGPIWPAKVSSIGAKSHNLDFVNTASAPYWVYTGSTGGGSTVLDKKILVMSSSLLNESYNSGYKQGIITYTPGASEYFPNGQEPRGTELGQVESDVIFKVDDEIRFQNNENFTYVITKVTPPQENIEGDGVGRVKIQLNKEVSEGINKDFFLVRRFKENTNSFILDQTLPYDSIQSASNANGTIYPEFPASGLQESSSIIITNLVSKGIIT